MDVFIEVLDSHRIAHNQYVLKTKWWNLGYTQIPWILSEEEYIHVKNSLDWADVTHTATNKRIKPGLPT